MISRLLAGVTAAICLAALPTAALAYCSEPSAPYCASSYSDFSDEYEFTSCRNDMESYAREVDDYTSCLRRDLDILRQEYETAASRAANDADDAISEYNDAVESFNRRAN